MSQFSDYERATDTLLFLSDQFTLDFVVLFAAKDKFGQRSFFHSESEYESDKYNGYGKYRSIRRKMTHFYFAINNKKAFDGSFTIRMQDIPFIKNLFDNIVLTWYDPVNGIFSEIDKKLIISGTYAPVLYAKNEYQYLKIEPLVFTLENNQYKQGARITVNSDNAYADIDIDKLYGLYYILTHTDMYTAACSIATYTKVPPYDVNTWTRPNVGGLASGYATNSYDNRDWAEDEEQKPKKVSNTFLDKLAKKKKEKD